MDFYNRMKQNWMQSAAIRYDSCIRDTLNWMLERGALGGGLLNTKVNSLTGTQYDHQSGLRGPDFTYGWIQGRGLEALATFADYYNVIDPPLSERLRDAATALYKILATLQERDGHVYFLYDKTTCAIRQGTNGIESQQPAGSIFTYSDAFVAKGLLAASCQFDSARSGQYVAYLLNVVAAIEDGRFQMDETRELCDSNARCETDDFGPKMILLGAAGVLHRCNRSTEAEFADRFISDVLERHFDPVSGLLLNVPGKDTCNVGHAIEFCGFAFEHACYQPDAPYIEKLVSILSRSLETGLQGPGIALSLSAISGKAVSPYYPWWPMPETIRACALGMKLTGNTHLSGLWEKADVAFFNNYWQASQHFAYQSRTVDGPVDFVPATPDLDPGYHTGLSMLAAIRAMDRMS
ncbi:MAG: hypothetical protein ACI82O_001097 [Patiriisocius sp.]|jgi:hypothetical protein